MRRYLLDTNVVSEVTKPRPRAEVTDWLARFPGEVCHIATISLAEIRRGLLIAPSGRRRDELLAWYEGPLGPPRLFAGRTLPFDERAAGIWAELMAEGRAAGRPRNALDMIVAATGLAAGCTVVTLNARDFAGIDHLDPAA